MKALRRLLLFLLIASLAAGWLWIWLARPYAGFERETFVELPRGAGTLGIARRLQQSGVIRHSWQFLVVRALNPHRLLQAGEYRFDRPASVFEVFDRIARGDVFYYELAVPEGQNMFDIAASLERLGVMTAREFLDAARNPAGIRDLDPAAPTLEGYLFPETYRISRHQTASEVCRMMTAQFRRVWDQLGSPPDAHTVVTLASLVEKEAAVPQERPLIASVFHNRLKIGMKLDCDPTAVYASILEGAYRGAIYQSDLNSLNPYNTYRNPGLPPGPIANPGKASLLAALHPAETEYLYFVLRTDGSGRHEFSKDIAAHRAAVAAYHRANRASKTGDEKAPAARISGGKKAGHHR